MQKYHLWLIFLGGTLLFLFPYDVQPTTTNQELEQNPPIVVIGGSMCDFFLELNYENQALQYHPGYIHFEEGKKIPLKQLSCYSGGGGLNAAWALKKLGHEVRFISAIGTDSNGCHINNHLTNANITTQYLQEDPDHYTGTSFILPSPRGNNTILMSRGANQHLKITQDQVEKYLHNTAGLYLAPLSGESITCSLDFARTAHKKKIPVLCNPSSYQLKKPEHFLSLLPYINALLLNETEAKIVAQYFDLPCENIKDQIKLIKTINSNGPQICIITNGSHGSLCGTSNQTILLQKPCPVVQKKSVGAGDTFGATFFGALIEGYSITQSLLLGTLNSASILAQAIPHEGLLTFEKLNKHIQQTQNLPACYEIQ